MEDKLSGSLTLKELNVMMNILKIKTAIHDYTNNLVLPIFNRMDRKGIFEKIPDECFTIQNVPDLEILTQLIKNFDKLTECCSYQSAKDSINKNIQVIITDDILQCKKTENILAMHLKHSNIDMVRMTTENAQFTVLREFYPLRKNFKFTLAITEIETLSNGDLSEFTKDIFEYPEGVSHQSINTLKLEMLRMLFDKYNPYDI